MEYNKKKIGRCGICGKFKPLTFEHTPPRSTGNSKPIYIQRFDHLYNKSSFFYNKKSISHRGFGDYIFCKECNKMAGDNYINNGFIQFIVQGNKILKENIEKSTNEIAGEYQFKPLNVLKQIIILFLAADKTGYLRSQKDLIKFVQIKELIVLPKRFQIYLYSNSSPHKRMIGVSSVRQLTGEIGKWSEINFQPFGYFLTENIEPPNKFMCEISMFGNFEYDKMIVAKISTPYLIVNSPNIGQYANLQLN